MPDTPTEKENNPRFQVGDILAYYETDWFFGVVKSYKFIDERSEWLYTLEIKMDISFWRKQTGLHMQPMKLEWIIPETSLIPLSQWTQEQVHALEVTRENLLRFEERFPALISSKENYTKQDLGIVGYSVSTNTPKEEEK